jgi:hypothetical protein
MVNVAKVLLVTFKIIFMKLRHIQPQQSFIK